MRIALAQLNPIVGDVAGNLDLVLRAMEDARAAAADVLITSELVLLGYPPRDLIFREGVVESCEDAVQAIAEQSGGLTVVVGHPRREQAGERSGVEPFRNSISVCRDGRIVEVYDKRLLPGYDVFDEDRYFAPGDVACVVEIAGRRVGLTVCEDLWRAEDVTAERSYAAEPVRETAALGCDVIFSLNASPFVAGKWHRHLDQLKAIATEHSLPVVAVHQVGGFDDLVFDGRSIIVGADGGVIDVLPGWKACVKTIELSDAGVADQETRFHFDPLEELFSTLVLGVRDYCGKIGREQVLIGLSGGIDSALTAAIAAAAIGAENISGLIMPSKFSSGGSVSDARDLADRLGIGECRQAPIHDMHESARAAMDASTGDPASGVTDENIQARLRGLLLMAHANATDSLVLVTSNKSELAVGYSTLYGDMCGALSVIGDVLKTTVYELARWINANFSACGFDQPPIPEASINKAPSAELKPDQTDQDSLPPYEVLDQIVERYVDLEQSAETIVRETSIDEEVVRKFTRLIDINEFKRHQAAVILKVSPRAFGRGRPMPIVMKSSTVQAPRPVG